MSPNQVVRYVEMADCRPTHELSGRAYASRITSKNKQATSTPRGPGAVTVEHALPNPRTVNPLRFTSYAMDFLHSVRSEPEPRPHVGILPNMVLRRSASMTACQEHGTPFTRGPPTSPRLAANFDSESEDGRYTTQNRQTHARSARSIMRADIARPYAVHLRDAATCEPNLSTNDFVVARRKSCAWRWPSIRKMSGDIGASVRQPESRSQPTMAWARRGSGNRRSNLWCCTSQCLKCVTRTTGKTSTSERSSESSRPTRCNRALSAPSHDPQSQESDQRTRWRGRRDVNVSARNRPKPNQCRRCR